MKVSEIKKGQTIKVDDKLLAQRRIGFFRRLCVHARAHAALLGRALQGRRRRPAALPEAATAGI